MRRVAALIATCGVLVASLLAIAGCFSPDYGAGGFPCSPDGQCPSGYQCTTDHVCLRQGADLSANANPDLGDMMAPPDLTPVITAAPPAAVYTCAGGGSGVSASGLELNVSLGGTIAKGTSVAPSGAVLTSGYFSSDTQ